MKKPVTVIILIGISLISFCSLMIQIAITRIFSTIIWYHYAFIAVSVAMFGWGFGGLFVHFLGPKLKSEFSVIASIIAFLFSLSIPAFLWGVLRLPFSLNLYYIISVVPFFIGGTCMSFVFGRLVNQVNRIYFADLVGASLGTLLIEPSLIIFGAENLVLLIGVIAAISSILFALVSQKRKVLVLGLIGLVITCGIFLNNVQNFTISIDNVPGKGLFQMLRDNPQCRLVYTKWNSYSRIDVVEGTPEPVLAQIFIDADASTSVLRWNGTLENAQFLKNSINYLPYYVINAPRNILIIGSGGGIDIVTAIVGNGQRILAVELNPIIVEVVKSYGDQAGHVYTREGVDVIIDEGRSFISRSNEKFDVIVLNLVDSWAALSAGGYALAENYLYTLEAFQQYFDHLTDQGILSMVRWSPEIPKLVSTAFATLTSKGVPAEETGKHMAVVTWESAPNKIMAQFLLKRTPFTSEQAQYLRDTILTMGSRFGLFYIPYLYSEEPYTQLLNGSISLEVFCSRFAEKVEPVTDNNPYYFSFEKPMPKSLSNLIIWIVLLVFGFITLPLIIQRRKAKLELAAPFILYFTALGLAYMFLELALIQKFILFLGYPTRALSVILFSLLLWSGIGSFVSGLIKKESSLKLIFSTCLIIFSITMIYAFFIESLFATLLSQDATARILVAFLLISPLGFFMGFPFPTGIKLLSSKSNPTSVPWMWAINGAASVLGSILATATGITLGLSCAMFFAAMLYLIALVAALRWRL